MNFAEWIMFGVLAGFSIYDLRTRRIPVAAVILLAVAVVVYRLYLGTFGWNMAAGLVPGAVLLVTAFFTKESIGVGDGLVLCVLGVFCGLGKALAILGTALVLSAVLAIILLVLKRVNRKTELPSLPCLCAGYLLCIWW